MHNKDTWLVSPKMSNMEKEEGKYSLVKRLKNTSICVINFKLTAAAVSVGGIFEGGGEGIIQMHINTPGSRQSCAVNSFHMCFSN